MRLSEIAAEYGEDIATRAAILAVRQADDGEPFLMPEELERIFADLLAEGRDR